MPLDLLLIGDATIDMYMKIAEKDTFPPVNDSGGICFHHGSKVLVEDFETSVAGNAVNVAIGCSKLGHKTGLYTEMGDDQNAGEILQVLKENKVDTSAIGLHKDKKTDVHPVIVYRGERTIFSFHEKFDYKIKNWPKTKWIYYTSLAETFPPFQAELAEYVKEHEVGLAVNPGTIQMKMGVHALGNILLKTDILLVNREEALALTGCASGVGIYELHDKLHDLGPQLTVVTDGLNGVTAKDFNGAFEHMDIYDTGTLVMDRTGAGDAFSAGFMSAILHQKELKEALAWGVINAGCVVREIGASNGLLSLKEMEEKVANLLNK